MKRKIFSKLLMGAFLIASVSSFVSCKDYDDDINNLQKQIDAAALKADLTALQQTLAAQISEAKSAAAAAQAAAEAAQATANNAATKDALEAVKTAATNAGAVAAQALADAANAQGTADVAKSAAQAAQEAAAAAQTVANGASDKAATALADAAKALASAEGAAATAKAAQEAATAANAAAGEAKTIAGEAKATADNALAAAGNATTQAAEALKAAGEAKTAAEAAKYNDEAVKLLIAQAQASADAAAEDAKDAAEAAAAAVLASASATEESAAAKAAADKIDEAIAEATKAINEATESKIAAAVAEAIKGADQNEGVKELATKLEQLGNAQAGLATKEALEEQVKDLQGKIESATVSAETIAEVAAAAGTIKDALNEFLTAITSVELFSWNGDYLNRLDHRNLEFFWAEEVQTWKFGMDLKASDKGVSLTNDQMTDYTIDFTKGLVNISKDSVVVRVVPIKAELTPDMVCLVNTQGDTISSEFIKVGKPYRLTEKLYTRATDVEVGGLWVIPFEVNKENFTAEIAASKKKIDLTKRQPYAESFNAEWSDTEKTDGDYNNNKKYLYAVAVKTHQGDAEANSRRIITQHDLTLKPVMAVHAADYFDVTTQQASKDATTGKITIYDQTWNINGIHNRYTVTEEEKIYTTKLPEYNYMSVKTAEEKYYNYANWGWFRAYAPADMVLNKTITSRDGKGINTGNSNDDRQNRSLVILDLDVNNEIKIDFSAWRASSASSTALSEYRIKAFYVTLDADYALESKASELQAWSTYEYTNLADEKTVAIYDVANRPIAKSGKMFESETGVIVFNVPEEKKEALRGEIVGFRVYAVNYDGTVVNPDGRAFYVQIKKKDAAPVVPASVDVTITATKEKGDVSDFKEIPAAFLNNFVKGGHYGWGTTLVSTTPYFPNGTDMYREITTSYKDNTPETSTKKEDYTGGTWKDRGTNGHQNPSFWSQPPFTVTFYKADKKTTTKFYDPEVKYFKATINAEELVDDETYTIGYQLYEDEGYYTSSNYIAQLNINVKKVIDDKAKQLPAWFGVKPEAVHDGKVRICLVPSQTNGANADQAHTNYYGAGYPFDFNSTSVANAAWYQVFETLKGAKATPDDIVLSFNNSDAFDTQANYPLNCKTDKYLDADNDGVGVSTFYYNTTPTSWLTKGGAWTAADEWSQWGTTENLYVFSNPKASIDNVAKNAAAAVAAGKAPDLATATKMEYQKIRNSWPAVTDVKVGAYYDNPNGPKISRTRENKTISGSTTKQVDEMLITAAHSVKADVDNWMTFTYACWHHSAKFYLGNVSTYDQVFSDMTLQYGLKATTKAIALSVKYGDDLTEYKYYDGTETTPSNTKIAMNGSIKIKDILGNVKYTNPYLTTNTGYSVSNMIKPTLDNTIASQAFMKEVNPDVAGNVYPRVVPTQGYDGTDASLATLTYYKYDTVNNKLVKRDNTASFVTPLYEYIQYHYVDFFGHDIYVEIPFYIHN